WPPDYDHLQVDHLSDHQPSDLGLYSILDQLIQEHYTPSQESTMANTFDFSCAFIGFFMQDNILTPITKGGLRSLGVSLSIYLDDFIVPSPSHHMILMLSLSNFPNALYKDDSKWILRVNKQLEYEHLKSNEVVVKDLVTLKER
ncbi:unnamed protein product, partial [Vicia faba]